MLFVKGCGEGARPCLLPGAETEGPAQGHLAGLGPEEGVGPGWRPSREALLVSSRGAFTAAPSRPGVWGLQNRKELGGSPGQPPTSSSRITSGRGFLQSPAALRGPGWPSRFSPRLEGSGDPA